jgi:asparagine synthase (glutamine-hydrolysing)
MCGIAGIIDLAGTRAVPPDALPRMAAALRHRGPDDGGFLEQPGLGLAARRLSILGLADGRQPMTNEDGSVVVVFNGEAFDYPELRAALVERGHRLTTHCDTEVLPHLWEDEQEGMFGKLRGQFALALWDQRRQRLTLARDRFGICPLHWARITHGGGDWLLFASEIKALFASGLVGARPDPRGIDQLFTFFALPGPVTCFEGVQALLPGHYLTIQRGASGGAAQVGDRAYWEMDYPDREEGGNGHAPQRLVEEFEALLVRSVQRRLRADVPVAAYLSGGVDSSLVAALASRLRKQPVPTFTIGIREPGLDEAPKAARVARFLGSEPVVLSCGPQEILAAYPRLIRAAEAPVSDTCCAALLLLAQEVHARGFKVVLTGEGADEGQAGYPWYKLHKLLGLLDVLPGLPVGQWLRRGFFRWQGGSAFAWANVRRLQQALGGHHAWLDLYGVFSLAKPALYGPRLRPLLTDYSPGADLGLNVDRLRRWHPLHQSLYLGLRVHLAGLLLSLAGDRVAMHSSVEARYPFLDEEVMDFLARTPPGWKLRGFQDKYLLRVTAGRWLPRDVAWRPKAMFRAPFDAFGTRPAPAWIGQLLSDESLRRTGYFDVANVRSCQQAFRRLRPGSPRRVSLEIGLSGVLATQLWHHTFIDATLADLPSFQGALLGGRTADEHARGRTLAMPASLSANRSG